MSKPIVYGTPISPYVRNVRMALVEKDVDYEHVDVGVLDGECHQEDHLARHPFGKVPAFSHGDFDLYETGPILRYIDQVFDRPSLIPGDARAQARMNQIMSIVDYYGYGSMIGGVVAYYFFPDLVGGRDDDRLAEGRRVTETCLSEFERLKGDNPYLAGDEISLADLYLVPYYFYLSLTPIGDDVLGPHPGLEAWWKTVSQRDSVVSTVPDLG